MFIYFYFLETMLNITLSKITQLLINQVVKLTYFTNYVCNFHVQKGSIPLNESQKGKLIKGYEKSMAFS